MILLFFSWKNKHKYSKHTHSQYSYGIQCFIMCIRYIFTLHSFLFTLYTHFPNYFLSSLLSETKKKHHTHQSLVAFTTLHIKPNNSIPISFHKDMHILSSNTFIYMSTLSCYILFLKKIKVSFGSFLSPNKKKATTKFHMKYVSFWSQFAYTTFRFPWVVSPSPPPHYQHHMLPAQIKNKLEYQALFFLHHHHPHSFKSHFAQKYCGILAGRHVCFQHLFLLHVVFPNIFSTSHPNRSWVTWQVNESKK